MNSGWSDYVLDPGYRLHPLESIASYINANHHLPGMPSAAEVQEHGVSVGDIEAKLLATVEELTLHMIRLEHENEELRQKFEVRTAGVNGAPAAAVNKTGTTSGK